MASVNKQFHRLMQRVGKISDGQASVENIVWDDGCLESFFVVLRPNSGHYKGGTFHFEVMVHDACAECLTIVCRTEIYHPNIDTSYMSDDTNVCLSLLDNPPQSFGFEGLIHGLVFLLKYPNLDDPLSPYFNCTPEDNFYENVKRYMAGESIDEVTFDTGFVVVDGVLVETKPSTNTEEKNDKCETQAGTDANPSITDTSVSDTPAEDDNTKNKLEIDDLNTTADRFNNPDVIAPKLRRSFSETNLHTIIQALSDSLGAVLERHASLSDLPDSLDVDFKELLDNYDYSSYNDVDEDIREFVEMDGDIYLVAAELVEAFKRENQNTDQGDNVVRSGTVARSQTNNNTQVNNRNAASNTVQAAGSDGFVSTPPSAVATVTETCVDTGDFEVWENELFFVVGSANETNVTRKWWPRVHPAFQRLVIFFRSISEDLSAI